MNIEKEYNYKENTYYNWNKTKFSSTITEIGKVAIEENKRIKLVEKEANKKAMLQVGYNKDEHYTKREMKKFVREAAKIRTRKFEEVIITKEEFDIRKLEDKKKKKELLNNRPHISKILEVYKNLKKQIKDIKNNPKNNISSNTIQKEESKDNKKRYHIVTQKKSEKDPMKSYDFYTETITATKEEAENKAISLRDKYKNDKTISGIKVQEVLKDNTGDSKYFPALEFAA